MFQSYLAPVSGLAPRRDLASFEIWDVSLTRSLRRRALAERHRKAAPKTKGTAAAVSAALLVSPLLPFATGSAHAGGNARSAPPLPRPPHGGGVIAKLGDRSAEVASVQRALRISSDSVFGPITQRSVKRFQSKAGLARDGVVGPKTWTALVKSPVPAASEKRAAPKQRAASKPRTVAVQAPSAGNCGGPITAPVNGERWGGFGDGRNHAGVDIGAAVGTAVRAAACGTVTSATDDGSGYGNLICVAHSSTFSTCYAHLSKINVSPGERVEAGQVIGRAGMTGRTSGPHLHFETRVDGSPVDPAPYLSGASMIPGAAPSVADAPSSEGQARSARVDRTGGAVPVG
ncbi:MAG: peptidoglycan DD-metalloendopeptidase family protein [Solirubrobacteraceae bacterium]